MTEEEILEHVNQRASMAVFVFGQGTGYGMADATVGLLSVLVGNLRWAAPDETKAALLALAAVPAGGTTRDTPEGHLVNETMHALRKRAAQAEELLNMPPPATGAG